VGLFNWGGSAANLPVFPSYLTDLPYKTAAGTITTPQTTPLFFFKSKIIQQLISDLFGQIAFGTKIELSYLQLMLLIKIGCDLKVDIFCCMSLKRRTENTATIFNYRSIFLYEAINPNVAKVGGLQSQGVKGEVVVVYLESLTTQDLKSSGFPEG
jgi:hypothetical protein